jgi:uncharacterized protein (DUF342 family)
MNKLQQLLLGAILVTLVSCNGKSALAFNEKMVSIQGELLKEVEKMDADTSGNATTKLTNVRNFALIKLGEIKATEAPSNGEGFKTAMAASVNGMIESYNLLIKISSAPDDDPSITGLQTEYELWEKKLEKLDEDAEEAQKKFAKANNITLK